MNSKRKAFDRKEIVCPYMNQRWYFASASDAALNKKSPSSAAWYNLGKLMHATRWKRKPTSKSLGDVSTFDSLVRQARELFIHSVAPGGQVEGRCQPTPVHGQARGVRGLNLIRCY